MCDPKRPRTAAEAVRVSREGGAREEEDQAILALATAAGLGDERTRRAALAALPEVCRSGADIARFAELVEASRGYPAPTPRTRPIADVIFVRGAL
jgi:60 kDa SS-A/Ro ribonucleoprotein